jgi:hypothetical protein
VFCATKKELYREIFVSPELYLDRLYLAKREPIALRAGVNIFDLPQLEGDHGDHASRKVSACLQDPIEESEDDELEMEEESEKEMLEEEAREMPNSIEISSSMPEPSELSSGVSNNLHRINEMLANNVLPAGKEITFIYHQFCY